MTTASATETTLPSMLAWTGAPSLPLGDPPDAVALVHGLSDPHRPARPRRRRAGGAECGPGAGRPGRRSTGRDPAALPDRACGPAGPWACAGRSAGDGASRPGPPARGSFAGAAAFLTRPQISEGSRSFGTGGQAAQPAAGAIPGVAGGPVGGDPQAEAAHDPVGLDGMVEEVAGAELGAERALVAGRPGDPPDGSRPPGVAAEERMIPRQDDQPRRRLGHRLREVVGQPAHHGPADEDAEVGLERAARGGDDIRERGADGRFQGHGAGHQAGHGQGLAGHRPAAADIDQRLHVLDHGVHVLGQAAGPDDPAGDLVDQDELVARGIYVVQGMDLDAGRASLRATAAARSAYFFLRAMIPRRAVTRFIAAASPAKNSSPRRASSSLSLWRRGSHSAALTISVSTCPASLTDAGNPAPPQPTVPFSNRVSSMGGYRWTIRILRFSPPDSNRPGRGRRGRRGSPPVRSAVPLYRGRGDSDWV